MTADATPILPGRLGTPDMMLKDDPRADPRMLAAMAPMGLDVAPEPAGVDADSPIEQLIEFCDLAEPGFVGLGTALFADLPAIEGVESEIKVIKGVDGNDITLFVHRPADAARPLPAVLHLHGGGMTILEAADPNYGYWRDSLAATGLVVVGVEFRNAAGKLGPHPFPAGLNDCASGLQWLADNKDELGVSKIVVSGESGGGNLTLATVLKAKADGKLDLIDGAYAQCPYISGLYAHKDPALPSLYENDGYFLDVSMLGAMARVYDPGAQHDTDPLAWPYHASAADLEGLPPHVISVNELDPLRDEGLAYFRKLTAAGVSAVSRTVNGTCHAGDCLLPLTMPEVHAATIRDIKGFAESL